MKITDLLNSLNEKFEDVKPGRPITIIGYHWTTKDGLTSLLKSPKNNLFFADDPKVWASPWMKDQVLVKMSIKMNNPFVEINSNREFEGDFGSNKTINLIRRNGFDGIIYTPSSSAHSARQGLLFKPSSSNLKIISYE